MDNNDPVYVTFEFNGNLGEEVNKVTLGIKGMRDESAATFKHLLQGGSGAASSVKELTDQLGIQKKVIAELESEYKRYKSEFDKVNISGHHTPEQTAARQQAKKLYQEARAELDAEKKALGELEKMYAKEIQAQDEAAKKREAAANKQVTVLTQMRQIREEMASLTNADGTVSGQNLKRYDELKNKLGEVGTAYRRTREEQKYLTTAGNAQLAGLMQGITGLAGAFSAGQGVVSLFVKDNERLAAIQTKLQAAMAITVGLQQVSTTLHATSAFRINTVTKVTELWRVANTKLAASLGMSAAAANVLMGVYTLGLSVAIPAIIVGLSKLSSAHKKAVEDQKKFAKSTADTSAQSLSDFERLRKSYDKLGGSLEEKNKFIIQNQDSFKNLGVQISNVNDADNLFIKNAAAFRDSVILRAKAVAAMELASEKYKEVLEKMAKAEAPQRYVGTGNLRNQKFDSGSLAQQFGKSKSAQSLLDEGLIKVNPEWEKYQKELEKEEKGFNSYIDKYIVFTNQATAKLKDANINSLDNIEKGTKAWWEGYKQIQEDALTNFKDTEIGSKEYKAIEAERNKAAKILEKWSKPQTGKQAETELQNQIKAASKLSEVTAKQSRERLRHEEDIRNLIEEARISAMRQGGEKTIAQMEFNHKKEMNELTRQKEDYLQKIIAFEREKFEADAKNKGKMFDASTISLNEKEEASFAELRNALLKKQKAEEAETCKTLLSTYQTYAEKRLEAQRKFQAEREALQKIGASKENQDELNRQEKEALEAIDRQFGEREKSFEAWASKITGMSLEQLSILLGQAENALAVARLKAGNGLEPGDSNEVARYRAQILALQEQIQKLGSRQNGPGKAYKEWKNLYEVLGSVNSELREIGDNIGGAAGELLKFASGLTTSTLQMISSITTLTNWSVEATRMAAEGASSAMIAVEKASVILAVVSAGMKIVSGIMSAFSSLGDAGREREAALKSITTLQQKYNETLVETKLLHDGVWGRNSIGDMINAVDALSDATENYNKVLGGQQKQWKDPTSTFWDKAYKYGTLPGWAGLGIGGDKSQTGLKDNLRYITKKSSNGFLGIGGNHTKTMDLEQWVKENLKNSDGTPANLFLDNGRLNLDVAVNLVEGNSDYLAGETKESLEKLIEAEKTIRQAEEAMRSYIADTFGELGDAMSGSIIEAFRNGTDAAESFRDSVTSILESIGQQIVRNLFAHNALKDYEDKLKPVYERYASSNDQKQFADELFSTTDDFFKGFGAVMQNSEEFLKMWDSLGDKYGYDLFKPNNDAADAARSASQKGLEAINQDSADALNGRFTTMVYYQDKIHTAMIDMRGFLLTGLDKLSEIATNTGYCRRLEAIDSNMERLSKSVEAIIRDGLILKK